MSIPASRDERNTEQYSRKDSEDSLPIPLGHRQAWKEITAVSTLHAKNTQVTTGEGSVDRSDNLRPHKGDSIHRRGCALGLRESQRKSQLPSLSEVLAAEVAGGKNTVPRKPCPLSLN